MTIQQLPVYTGEIPKLGQDQSTFNANINDKLNYDAVLVPAQNQYADDANALALEIENNTLAAANSASEANQFSAQAASNANFKGNWPGDPLTPGYPASNIPASYRHNDKNWQQLQDIADITQNEPVDGAFWVLSGDINSSNINFYKVKTSKNITDMINGLTVGGVAYPRLSGDEWETLGYYNQGDGGGGKYILKTGSSDGHVDIEITPSLYAELQGEQVTSRQVGALWDSTFNDSHAIENYYRLNSMLSNTRFNRIIYSNPLGTEISVTGSVNLLRSNIHITHEAGSRVTGKYEVIGQPADIKNGGQLFGFIPTDWLTNPLARIFNVLIDGTGEIETYHETYYSTLNNNNAYGGGKADNFKIKDVVITGADHGGIVFDYMCSNISVDDVEVTDTYDVPIVIKNTGNPDVPGTPFENSYSEVNRPKLKNNQWGGASHPVFVYLAGRGVFHVNGGSADNGSIIKPQGVTAFDADIVKVTGLFVSGCQYAGRNYRTKSFTMNGVKIHDCDYPIAIYSDSTINARKTVLSNSEITGNMLYSTFSDRLSGQTVAKGLYILDNDFSGVTSNWGWVNGPEVPSNIVIKDNNTDSANTITYQFGRNNYLSHEKIVPGSVINMLGDNGDFPYRYATLLITQGPNSSQLTFDLTVLKLNSSVQYKAIARAGDYSLTNVKATRVLDNVNFTFENTSLGFTIINITLSN